MQGRQFRTLSTAAGLILVVWLVACTGYIIARSTRMTGDKIKQYIQSIDFAKLSAADRAKALRELADKLNSLSLEERRNARWQKEWKPWFDAMTESEREMFVEATLPTDVKQMIDSFEKMPADKRKKTIDDALKNLKKARDTSPSSTDSADSANGSSTNSMAAMDPELVQKAQTLGLKTFYSESSPETKAELAPLLEEIQSQMQSGRTFR